MHAVSNPAERWQDPCSPNVFFASNLCRSEFGRASRTFENSLGETHLRCNPGLEQCGQGRCPSSRKSFEWALQVCCQQVRGFLHQNISLSRAKGRAVCPALTLETHDSPTMSSEQGAALQGNIVGLERSEPGVISLVFALCLVATVVICPRSGRWLHPAKPVFASSSVAGISCMVSLFQFHPRVSFVAKGTHMEKKPNREAAVVIPKVSHREKHRCNPLASEGMRL